MKKSLVFMTFALLLSITIDASARGIGAADGHPSNDVGDSKPCWTYGDDIPMKNCGTLRQSLYWNLPVDAAGTRDVSFSVTVPFVNGVPTYASCTTYGVDQYGSSIWFGSFVSNNQAGVIKTGQVTLTSTNVFVPVNGYLVGRCWIEPQASIGSIVWAQ
jgi:hypothetical protein